MLSENILNEDILSTDLLFGKLWEISVDGMRLIDEEGIILLVNDAYCKTVEKSKDDLIGKPFSTVYAIEEQKSVLSTFKKDVENEAIKTRFERDNTLWNKRKVWFEFSNTFLTLPDGNKLTLSIIKDITERKKSEIELRESEYKYKMLFNSANDAVFVTQLSTEKTYGDFIEVNEIACKRLGYSKEEFLLLSPSAIVSPHCIDEFNKNLDKLLNEGHVIYDLTHRAKDKKLIPVEISSHLFLLNDKLTVLSIARDITERKLAEEKLKKTSKRIRDLAVHLQSIREEERGLIAREIHDELGQTLTVLKIQISLLANKLRDDQQVLKEKINQIAGLIDDTVENVQRISAKLRPGVLDELGLVAAIEWQVDEFEKLTGLKTSLVISKDEISLDKNKSTAIFRIFQEALTNIARHSQADRVSVSLQTDASKVYLEVKDNGKGISQEQIKDLRSLGILGMKERAYVFGGEVYIEGILGKGTEVKAEIPIE